MSLFKTVQSLIDKDDSTPIQLTLGSRKLKPGEHIPKGEARATPTLSWPAAAPGQKYLVVSIDLDAPFPSFAPLSPVLHWIQGGLELDTTKNALTSSDPVLVAWAPPGPPGISGPHRYIFLLYHQPAGFTPSLFAKEKGWGIRDRIKWDQSKFEREANLGHAVAATYFLSN
ncbi:hypothetical protein A1O3_09685 [Capronia epimyces CBS 606.96]|uniref:Phosphatidylethanolamine-binding protein n=1 Tax=Capronia epimyces CBS 606.96 TaxID=1182542 RepID=W9Y4T9_9EURO|nr:uncharacterized protein A1O3_09685 [Capronia epimyces CBS 606.96]EXJ77459.1 hypothetical protein A1O3_09685 [Capronia epimyces CBS 606.96]